MPHANKEMATTDSTRGRETAVVHKNPATGPRTAAGKERTKNNALKHGIFSKAVFWGSESQPIFDALLNEYFAPIGMKLATLFWRYRRVITAEVKHIDEDSNEEGLNFQVVDSVIDKISSEESPSQLVNFHVPSLRRCDGRSAAVN